MVELKKENTEAPPLGGASFMLLTLFNNGICGNIDNGGSDIGKSNY